MNKIRLFLLDDHQIMIDGMRSMLEGDESFVIVGEANRAEDALQQIPACHPDIVISDINLPGMNGIDFTRKLLSENDDIRVLILTVSAGDHNISELLRSGVSGYLLKNAGREEVRKALMKIAGGGKYFSSEVAEGLMRMRDGVQTSENLHLTSRELEILQLIAREYSNKMIADQLCISERTVESHRKNIFRKTGVKSVVGLIRFAMENGYLKQ